MKNKKQKIIDGVTLVIHFIVFLVVGLVAAGALRQNNLKMLQLRDAVFAADVADSGVDEALKELRNFVTTHMNTSLPKLGTEKALQLKYTYERRVVSEVMRFKNDTNQISSQAKSNCVNAKNELSRIDCEQAYIKAHPVEPVAEIFPEQYSIEFVSPFWSFDLAGWLIIVNILIGLIFIARIIALKLANKRIKKLYK